MLRKPNSQRLSEGCANLNGLSSFLFKAGFCVAREPRKAMLRLQLLVGITQLASQFCNPSLVFRATLYGKMFSLTGRRWRAFWLRFVPIAKPLKQLGLGGDGWRRSPQPPKLAQRSGSRSRRWRFGLSSSRISFTRSLAVRSCSRSFWIEA